jgi:hypothetical protein
MTIKYGFDSTGGFAVVDTVPRTWAYAYPTSINANAAKRNPSKVASEMVLSASADHRLLLCATGETRGAYAQNYVRLLGEIARNA